MKNRRGAAVVLRVAAVLLIVVSPFLPPLPSPSRAHSVVFVVDRSASVGGAEAARALDFVEQALRSRIDERVGVVSFASTARVETPLGRGTYTISEREGASEDGQGTDIAGALRFARAALPTHGARRIVLLSDGRATRGRTLQQVSRLSAEGIQIDAVPIGGGERTVPFVASLEAAAEHVAQGEVVTLKAALRGPPRRFVQVEWLRDGIPLTTTARSVSLSVAGAADAEFTDPTPGPGVHSYAARIVTGAPGIARPSGGGRDGGGSTPASTSPADREPSEGRVLVTVGGRQRVLVLSLDGVCPAVLETALVKGDFDKHVQAIADGVPDAATLSGYDLLVLADVPVSPGGEGTSSGGLTPPVQERIVEFARQGGGVVVFGGVFGLAPEYAGTPIAKMLPVEIQDQGQVEFPRVAMAIMLDRSGSMTQMVGEHTKLRLALEAALASAAALRSDDLVAIGAVDTLTLWQQPLAPASMLAGRQQILRDTAPGGGGIYVYTALADAYRLLATAAAPLKHVILFADTSDSEEQQRGCVSDCPAMGVSAIDLARDARRAGMTTTVVGIGSESDKDTEFLRKLASTAGGRLYVTGNAADLKRIFVSETRMTTRSNLHNDAVRVAVREDHPILSKVDVASLPRLSGYVEARRRATATTALTTPRAAQGEERPILAAWRYGLGQVVVWTTDLREHWRGGWAMASAASQLLNQTLRHAIRRDAAAHADVHIALSESGADVEIELPEGDTGSQIAARGYLVSADGSSRETPLEPERAGPGRYAAHVATRGEPFLVVRVRDESGRNLGEGVGRHDGSLELAAQGPDELALRQIASTGDGLYGPNPSATLRRDGVRTPELIASWPLALIAATCLVGLDVWMRRRQGKPRWERIAERELAGADLRLSS